ncbi:hypothetical protein GGI00_003082, partial [Coemansia sp. RSA 2681]
MAQNQGRSTTSKRAEAPMRRFREMHYHRFQLGTRSNIHGACLLRSHLPVRLPRPHTMQMIYRHPPPKVGFRRLELPQGHEARDQASYARLVSEHEQAVMGEIAEERARTAQWLGSNMAIARTHVVVATQSGLQFFVAGFGYWNVLDMNLNLTSESCVGVKAFEMWAASALQKSADDKQDEQMAELPVLIVALTTYVKRPNEIRNRTTDELGSYRLYALGADSLPPLSQEFVDRHALRPQESVLEGSSSGGGCRRSRSHSESMSPPQRRPTQLPPTVPLAETESLPGFATSPPLDMAAATAASDATRRASISHAAEAADLLAGGGFGSDDGEAMTGAGDFPGGKNTQAEAALLPINTYAYLEERLFSLKVNERTAFLDLDYLPFRISQDVAPGMPAVLLVAGNDNKVHRYALGCDRIVEIEPLLCPKTDVSLTFTAFDARVIGPYHVQITAHQEFAVALQASRALTSDEMASEGEKEEEKEEK